MHSFSRALVRRLTPHNPLYVISAGLFLRGLRLLYSEEVGKTAPWTMLALLAGYTVLVAALAVWVIRKIRVWDDARTIVLVVAVLLMSGSMLFDETVVQDVRAGVFLLAASWLFGVAVSESTIRSSGLPLPASCRLSWLGLLGVFHLWPALMSQVLYRRDGQLANGLSAAFPLAVSIAFLPVLVTLRRWSALTMPKDSGWSFPLYPLALFVLVGFGAGLRAPLLALSFGRGAAEESIFDAWMLLPLIAVAALAVVELAHIFPFDRRWSTAALLFPLTLIAAPLMPLNASQTAIEFQTNFAAHFGSPCHWGLALATLVGLAAARRHLPFAEWLAGLSCALLLLAGTDSMGFRTDAAHALPMGVVALAFAVTAIYSGHSTAVFAAAACLLSGSKVALQGQMPWLESFDSLRVAWLAVAAFVLLLFNDRRRAALGWIVGGLLIWVGCLQQAPPQFVAAFGSDWGLALWLVGLVGIGEGLCRATGAQGPRWGAMVNLLAAFVYAAYFLIASTNRLPNGVRWILAGLFVLFPAALASYAKRPRPQPSPD